MKTGKEEIQIPQPGLVALDYSPADSFLITCEKYNGKLNPHINLNVWDAKNGKNLTGFEWKANAKESIKTFKWMPNESKCARLAPAVSVKEANSIEIYENGNFSKASKVINARFPIKAAKKGDPPTFVNGKFNGMAFCPLNPNVPVEQSP